MNPDLEKVKSIFLEAVEKHGPDCWDEFLDQVCAGDDNLRQDVKALLLAHAGGGSRLEHGAIAVSQTIDHTRIEGPGSFVGNYKLKEQIGEGGFGVVYLAEQTEPVRRRVALKVIKPGMDTRQVIARFQAERQALALMDHPNIARVLDAGSTDSGRPYFAMELVKGVPITEYCDQCNLTTQDRLKLFVSVCKAVRHAHQRGIIHRDIKPTNVLIAIQDGHAVAKVIDFGVAKAIDQQLTEHTMLTAFAQMVGTPLYMSPEQAEMSALEVDTRTDIYSLGVLLYELLAGRTPFDKARIKSASLDELRRMIRYEEPPKPSSRISTLGDEASTIAEHRRTEPRKLAQTIRGDLDWIVMKAMEKDRTRRYETAASLINDVDRYLNDEPIQARPPSVGYRMRKFVRRNRLAVTSTCGTVLALSAIVALAIAAYRTDVSAKAAKLANFKANREAGLRYLDGYEGNSELAVLTLTEAIEHAPADATLYDIYVFRGRAYLDRDEYEDAINDARKSLELKPENNPAAHWLLALASQQTGDRSTARRHAKLAQQTDPQGIEGRVVQAIAQKGMRGVELLTSAVLQKPFDPALRLRRAFMVMGIVEGSCPGSVYDMAISDLEMVLTTRPIDSKILNPLLFAIVCCHRSPDEQLINRAKVLIDQWLKREPGNHTAQFWLGLYLQRFEQDHAGAIDVFRRLDDSNRYAVYAPLRFAESFAARRQFDKAIEACAKNSIMNAWPFAKRAQYYAETGKLQSALNDLVIAEVIQRKQDLGDDPLQWGNLFDGYMSIKDYGSALDIANEWVRIAPKSFNAPSRRARVRAALGQWDAAAADLSMAIDRDPDQILLRQRRADALAQAGRWFEAERDLTKVTELRFRGVDVYHKLALSRLAIGDVSGYKRTCEAMLKQFSNSDTPVDAHSLALTCALAPGAVDDYRIVTELAETVIESGESADFEMTLAMLLLRDGKADEALSRLQDLEHRQQNRSDKASRHLAGQIEFLLALTHDRLRNDDEADSRLQKANQGFNRTRKTNQETNSDWTRRLTLRLLKREAELAIIGSASRDDKLTAGRSSEKTVAGHSQLVFDPEPKYFPRWIGRGLYLNGQGKPKEAADAYAKAMELGAVEFLRKFPSPDPSDYPPWAQQRIDWFQGAMECLEDHRPDVYQQIRDEMENR